MKPLKYPLLILLFSVPAQAAPDCGQNYAQLAQHAADRVHDRYSVSKSEAPGLIAEYRDKLRNWIMYRKDRYYPILAVEDATPLKANLLARAAAGNKAVLKDAPLDIETIKAELRELLRQTKRYPADLNAFLEDTARKQVQLEAMERAANEGLETSHDIKLQMPIPKLDAQGNIVEVGMKPLTWDSRLKFDVDLKKLRREVKRRLEGPRIWQSREETYTLDVLDADGAPIVFNAMEYIRGVKKLDVYRGEYNDMMSRLAAGEQPESIAAAAKSGESSGLSAIDEPMPRARGHLESMADDAASAEAPKAGGAQPAIGDTPQIDPEMKALYDQLNDIYDPKGGLRKEFHAPYWAWKRLRWEQLWAEIKTILTKDRVKLTDNKTTKVVFDYLKNLSEGERKALGIDNLAQMYSIGGKNIYLRTIVGMGGTLVTAAAGGKSLISTGLDMWSQYKLEQAEKEACAAASSEAKFRTCVQDFLQSKFTVAAIKTLVYGNESFLDNSSKIKNPAVRKEVDDLINRRKAYLGNEIQKKENQDALDKAIKDVQGEQDPSSDAFREKLITSPRPEIFVFGLTGGDDDKATAYLGFQHPGQFKKNKDLVLQILSEGDEDKRKTLLTQLREKGADELADDVDSLISDREDYLADPAKYLKRGSRRRSTPVKPKPVDSGADKKAKTEPSDKTDKKDDAAEKKTGSAERDDTN